MIRRTVLGASTLLLAGFAAIGTSWGGSMSEVRFITLDPGHFHAGLVQKEMYQGVSPRVHVYAPLGADLLQHMNRILSFNLRKRIHRMQLEVHAGPGSLERMLKERPGNVVVLSGRNRGKIDKIKASVEAGLNVLSTSPGSSIRRISASSRRRSTLLHRSISSPMTS